MLHTLITTHVHYYTTYSLIKLIGYNSDIFITPSTGMLAYNKLYQQLYKMIKNYTMEYNANSIQHDSQSVSVSRSTCLIFLKIVTHTHTPWRMSALHCSSAIECLFYRMYQDVIPFNAPPYTKLWKFSNTDHYVPIKYCIHIFSQQQVPYKQHSFLHLLSKEKRIAITDSVKAMKHTHN